VKVKDKEGETKRSVGEEEEKVDERGGGEKEKNTK